MSFTPKTWVGRQADHLGRIILTPTGGPNEYDVSRSEGNVATEGDQISPDNLDDLEQRILAAIQATANGDGGGNANNALKLAGVLASAIIDASGNAQNALKLGGIAAANFPQISSGSWTPIVFGATTAGSPTFTTQETQYLKVGKLVYIDGAVVLSAIGGMAGNVRIGGFPFAANAWVSIDMPLCDGLTSGYNPSKAIISSSKPTEIGIACLTDTGYTWLDASRLTSTSALRLSGWYPTNS